MSTPDESSQPTPVTAHESVSEPMPGFPSEIEGVPAALGETGSAEAPSARPKRFWLRNLLLASVPLTALGLGLGVYAYPRVFPSKERLHQRYAYQGDQKMTAKDYAGAKAIYEKLLALDPSRPEAKFKLALACLGTDDRARGLGLIRELAPADSLGYPPAYLWIAKQTAEVPVKSADENFERLRQVRAYLKRVIEIEPEPVGVSAEAELMLGGVENEIGQYFETKSRLASVEALKAESENRPMDVERFNQIAGKFAASTRLQWIEAETAWTSVADQHPERWLDLANFAKKQAEFDPAKIEVSQKWAEKSLDHFRKELSSHPDDTKARIQLALGETFVENYETAESILAEGLTKSPNDVSLINASSVNRAKWYDSLIRIPGRTDVRYGILERALTTDPNSKPLLDRLSAAIAKGGSEAARHQALFYATVERGLKQSPDSPTLHFELSRLINQGGDGTVQGRAILSRLKDDPGISGETYQLLGEDAWKQGKKDEAGEFWNKGLQRAPNDSKTADRLANNLAWALAFGPKTDLPRALELITKAIEHQPEFTEFRHTRGLILVKMKRWKEAESDLILVSKLPGDRSDLHLALAEVYDNMNMPDIAKLQRDYAETKAKAKAAKSPEKK